MKGLGKTAALALFVGSVLHAPFRVKADDDTDNVYRYARHRHHRRQQ